VRVFEPGGFHGGNVFSDFLNALDIELSDEFERLGNSRVNQGLDQRFTELIQEQYSLFPNSLDFESTTLLEAFQALNTVVGVTRSKRIFSQDERAGILQYHLEGNRQVANLFMGEDGPLFDQSVKEYEKDSFRDGELEKLPGVLNKIWFDTVSDMDFGTFNAFKMRLFQNRYHAGDASALKKYRRHKIVNSICKRLFRKEYRQVRFSFPDPLGKS